ncbi:MAG: 50S ribosomal protein L25 [bacterium]
MEYPVNINSRETGSKALLKKLRREKKIPAVVYGADFDSRAVWVDGKEILKIVSRSKTSVLELHDGEKKIKAIIKDISYNPLTEEINHIDFLRLQAKHEVELKVPVKIVGSCPGVKEGGILDFVTRELEIKTIPAKIPQDLQIDVSTLGIGHMLKVSDIEIPEGITVLTPGDTICITVKAPRKEEEVPEPAEAGEGEPEVVKKGKEAKETEGTEEKEKGKGKEKEEPAPAGKKEKKGK